MPPVSPPEIEVGPLNRIARFSIHVTVGRGRAIFAILILLDLALVAAFLLASLPEARDLAPPVLLAWLDPTLPATLPWAYALLKLYGLAALCALMAASFVADQATAPFWRAGAILAAVIAFAESAGLTGWAAASGAYGRVLPFVAFLALALSEFPRRSRAAFVYLALAAAALVLAESDGPVAWLAARGLPLGADAALAAWRGGLRLILLSLLWGGVLRGMRDVQVANVRYLYRG